MKRFFEPVWKTFYSASFYGTAPAEGLSRAVVFFLFIVAMCAALYAGKTHAELIPFLKKDVPFIIAQIPEIRITDGHLSTVAPQGSATVKDPCYTIKSKDGKIIAVIDETAEEAPSNFGSATLYITGTQAVMVKSATEKRVYSLAAIKDFSLDQACLDKWVWRVYHWTGLVLFPFILIWLLFYRAFEALIVSIVAVGISVARKDKRSYGNCFALSLYALVPSIIAGVLLDIFTGHAFIGFYLSLLISSAYVVFASLYGKKSA